MMVTAGYNIVAHDTIFRFYALKAYSLPMNQNLVYRSNRDMRVVVLDKMDDILCARVIIELVTSLNIIHVEE